MPMMWGWHIDAESGNVRVGRKKESILLRFLPRVEMEKGVRIECFQDFIGLSLRSISRCEVYRDFHEEEEHRVN